MDPLIVSLNSDYFLAFYLSVLFSERLPFSHFPCGIDILITIISTVWYHLVYFLFDFQQSSAVTFVLQVQIQLICILQ